MSAMDAWLASAAHVRTQRGLVRRAHAHGGDMIDLASNDYLGLSRDDRVIAAAVEATHEYGTGARASRVVTGTLPVHDELESALCTLLGQPTALAFSSGYTANIGAVTALSHPDTLLVLDAHVHASVHDAARMGRSPVSIVAHNDVDALARVLEQRTQTRAVVVIESLYSVLGDAAPIDAIAALCVQAGAYLVVDEAHGVGVLGAGRGGVHAAGWAGHPHVIVTATLSKALGAMGGAVLGSPAVREHLVNAARTAVFDTALAPAPAAAATRACAIITDEPERVGRLHTVAARLAAALDVPTAAGPVQSLAVGSAAQAVALADALRAEGILVGCFRPPSVPDGISRIRLTAHATLSDDELTRAESALHAALSKGDA